MKTKKAFIRTKDGRVFYAKKKSKKDVELANDNLHWEAIPKGCNDYFTLDYEDDEIIKIANTIEKLCDEFVIDFGKTNYPTTNRYKRYADFENLKKEIEDREKNFYRYLNIDFIVYGAIWIDGENDEPILKSIAKMNNRGELELL